MISLPAWLRGRRAERLGTCLLVLIATWYWLRYFNRSTNLLDEGSTASQALRIVHGQLIYRDFFTVVTPGSYYTIAWLFQIFGQSLMVMRWAALVTGLGVLVTTLAVTRRLAPWPFAAAAALMTTVWGWFLSTPNFYSLEAAAFALLALALFLRGPGWIITAGMAAGMAAMTKQNVGAYTVAALLSTIWGGAIFDPAVDVKRRLRESGRFIGGVAVVVVPVLVWLVASGAGPYLYESWVYYPLAKYPERFSLPFPNFYPVLPEAGISTLREALPAVLAGRVPAPAVYEFWTRCVLHLPVVVYPLALVALAVLVYRARSRGDAAAAREGRAVLAVSLFGLLTLLQAWPRADATHILFGLQGTFAVLAYLLSKARSVSDTIWGVGTVVGLMPLILMLWNGYQRTQWEYQNYVAGLHVDRGRGIYTQLLEAQRIDTVTKYIVEHTTPDDPVFVVPWASGFNFLADRMNPARTDFLLFEDPEAYPCLLARLDERPPLYVIYGYTWDVDEKRFRDYAAPVDQYIRSRYAIEFSTDGYEIWRRIDSARQPGGFQNACRPRPFRWRDLAR